MRSIALLITALSALLTLTACTSLVSGRSTVANGPALPEAVAPTTPEEPPAPTTNERGNIPKALGEEAGFWGSSGNTGDGVTFSIDAVDVDPPCAEFGIPPESGRTLLLHIRIATGSDQEAVDVTGGTINPFSFVEIGTDGATRSAQPGMCTDGANSLSAMMYGPNQQYAGTIEIVVPEASGVLVLQTYYSAWEWTY